MYCTSKRVCMNNNKPVTVSDVIRKDVSSSWPWLSIVLWVFVCVSDREKSVWRSSAVQSGSAWRHAWVMRWMSSRLSRLPSSSVITCAVAGSSFVRVSVCVLSCSQCRVLCCDGLQLLPTWKHKIRLSGLLYKMSPTYQSQSGCRHFSHFCGLLCFRHNWRAVTMKQIRPIINY